MIIQLFSMDIKITEEEKFINLLCSLPDSWDRLVMDIGSNLITIMIEDVVASIMPKEMR